MTFNTTSIAYNHYTDIYSLHNIYLNAGVAKFDVSTGKQKVTPAKNPSLTAVFANTLISIAEEDRKVVAVTAAMPGGT